MAGIRDRFDSYVVPVTETGCMLWTGCWDSSGYGLIYHRGRPRKASRVAIEIFTGRVPLSTEYVLHRCDTRCCVNPDHLYIGTLAENTRDCLSRGRHAQVKKTHCPHGHEYSGDNLLTIPKTGERRCRTCNRDRMRATYRAKREG